MIRCFCQGSLPESGRPNTRAENYDESGKSAPARRRLAHNCCDESCVKLRRMGRGFGALPLLVAFTFLIAASALLSACGAKTPARPGDGDGGPYVDAGTEQCNGADEDLDSLVDEDFRVDGGAYLSNAHCGSCGSACVPQSDVELSVECQLVDGAALCVALECAEGFAVSPSGRCVSAWDYLCLPCDSDEACGAAAGASCARVGDDDVCVVSCDGGCPDGYSCNADNNCVPNGGGCGCAAGQTFELACRLEDPEGNLCAGAATCSNGVLSECITPEDICDGVDNDCDGVVDQAFRDERGAYSVDVTHCGACGVDCTESMVDRKSVV